MADILQEAKERWQAATDHYREEKSRMTEDLEFSNPASPKQWDDNARAERENAIGGARPCLTLDYTNQYIAQVVNDARQNKPGIEVSPSDSQASQQVAQTLEGMVRQIEYDSRAGIAYDRGIDHAARCGKGWIRIGTKMVNPALNEQEITILSVADPLSVCIDIDSTEPDGCDSQWGFVETQMTISAFERDNGPKKSHVSWGDGCSDDKFIRIAEHFYIVKTKARYLSIQMPDGSTRQILAEDREREEQELATQIPGFRLVTMAEYDLESNQVKWCKLSGSDILEETDFPSQWIPLVPVYGHELWVSGKRYICGLTRQLMDAQRLRNFERSAWVETIAQQPKAPWVIPYESVEGFKDQWASANRDNPAFLPFNALDAEGRPLPPPQRMGPPNGATAYAQGSQMAMDDMQAAVGMYRSNFGAASNAVSGRAKLADQREGDTATFHYVDNLSRSITHVGKIIIDMIPRVKDTRREARSLSISGSAKVVQIDPEASKAYREGPSGPIINPKLGNYGVRVKAGPAYNTLRQEAAANLSEIVGKNPQLLPILGPVWARMQDWPEAEHVSKLFLAMAPKPVQDLENQNTKIPPEAQALVSSLEQQLQQAGAKMQQMQAMLEQLQQQVVEKQTQTQIDMAAAQSKAQTDELNAQIKMGELALKERELGLKEREMALRELEAQASAGGQQVTAMDEGNLAINARKVEIEAFSAETDRKRLELEALVAQRDAEAASRQADHDAAREIVEAKNQSETAAQIAVANDQLRMLDQHMQNMMAPKQTQAKAIKSADGTWTLESVEVSADKSIPPKQKLFKAANVNGAWVMESVSHGNADHSSSCNVSPPAG